MLQAKDEEEKLVSLVQMSRKQVEKWRKQKFFCPICNQTVQLKSGRIRIPHFAHRSDQACFFKGAKESEEHLSLKTALAEWCLRDALDHQLEAYLPLLKQRADILIDRFAVEIQCSKLSIEEMGRRTASYIKNGYQPIWICGEKTWNSGKNSSALRKFCAYSESLGFYLWTADWREKKLYLRYHLESASANKLHYASKCWRFGEGRLDELFNKITKKNLFHFRKYDSRQEMMQTYQELYRKLRGRAPDILAIQSLYYQNGSHLLGLHYWFYYPINQLILFGKSIFLFKYHFWKWLTLNNRKTVTEAEIFDFCRSCIQREKLDQLFPLIPFSSLVQWQTHYLIEGLIVCHILIIEGEQRSFYIAIDPIDCVKPHSVIQFNDTKNITEVVITGTPLKI